ncbi:MAG TPA: hypothetical protein PL047_09905 [Methanothrix sp.]|nr:hypothetical protein [Methanothrix sp.]
MNNRHMLQHVKDRISSEKEALKKQIAFLEDLESALEMVEDLQRKVPDIHGLAKLIDRVDQIGRDVDMMKLRRGEPIAPPPPPMLVSTSPVARVGGKRGPKSRLDGHARLLLSMLSKAPGVYTVEDITEMLSMGKPAAIRIIRRAAELDPDHVKITTGSRRKIFVHYHPEGVRDIHDRKAGRRPLPFKGGDECRTVFSLPIAIYTLGYI